MLVAVRFLRIYLTKIFLLRLLARKLVKESLILLNLFTSQRELGTH